MTGRVCDKSPSHGYAPDGVCKWCEPANPTFLDLAKEAGPSNERTMAENLEMLTRRNPLLVDKPYEHPLTAQEQRDGQKPAPEPRHAPVCGGPRVTHFGLVLCRVMSAERHGYVNYGCCLAPGHAGRHRHCAGYSWADGEMAEPERKS